MTETQFQEIYTSYFTSIVKYLNLYTNDKYAIEEVIQDVFLKLWNERETLEIEYIKTYIFVTSRNKMLNFLRNRNTRVTLLNKWAQDEYHKTKGSDCINSNAFHALYKAAIFSLPTKCREIYTLSREEELTYKAIAEILEVSAETVENQMGIALKKIRHYISSHSEEL